MMFSLVEVLVQSVLLTQAAAHGVHRRSSPLDKTLTNTVPYGDGPTLYYNGSGPVPSINTTSPIPSALQDLTIKQIADGVVQELYALGSGLGFSDDECDICISSVEVLHIASLMLPQDVITSILVANCEALNLTDLVEPATCESYFSGTGGLGPFFA